jgi:tetratricopeptide (TPR) repeat protein
VLLLASSVWQNLGSTEMALALVRQAATHLTPGDHQQQAWVAHQEAKLLLVTGDPQRAESVLQRAIRHYRKQGDSEGEMRASTVKINILEAQGDITAALTLARKGIRNAERRGHDLSVLSCRLELARMLIEFGSPADGVVELHKLLAQAAALSDKIAEFYGHYYLWKAYQAMGDHERTRFECRAAGYFVDYIDTPSPEANEIRELLTPSKQRHISRR